MTAKTKNKKQDFLVELGTEELPPKALKRLATAFADGIKNGLQKSELNYTDVKWFATPRRLAVLVSELDSSQSDKEVQRRGPAITAAFGDDGCATPAAKGFAKSCGVEVEDLEKLETDAGAWLVFNNIEKGQATEHLIPGLVKTALDQLPIPKRMRWGSLDAEFVRPVHWLVLMLGKETVKADILSVKSGHETRGHRFHHPGKLLLGEAKAYEPLLETEGRVIVDFDKRCEAIRALVLEAAEKVKGVAVIDEQLLEEVASMVEWPVAVTGNFDKAFLDVPAEALITTMKSNQKYFHVTDKKGNLKPHFITISNIESKQPELVQQGNEKVVRPRFTDAEFFWKQDKQTRLGDRMDSLGTVVYQKQLGTVFEKVKRVAKLAQSMASDMGDDVAKAERAALLSKCDLMTDMVGEFPSLQGVMGRYYASHDGEAPEVAIALDEQYKPRFAGDSLPESSIGQILSIAEKIDTITGIFAINQIPTGDKDPFALRRAALGVLRIAVEKQLDLDLVNILKKSIDAYQSKLANLKQEELVSKCYEFIMDRARAYYLDSGITVDVFDAVLAQSPGQPFDFDQRVKAVNSFRQLPEAESLSAANKRIANILKKASNLQAEVDESLLAEPAEKNLYKTLQKLTDKVTPLFAKRDYQKALFSLAELRETVDQFFDEVMVMVDDVKLKNNRIALLQNLRSLFLQVADLSRLQS